MILCLFHVCITCNYLQLLIIDNIIYHASNPTLCGSKVVPSKFQKCISILSRIVNCFLANCKNFLLSTYCKLYFNFSPGGLLREWYGIMARELFNPDYALFTTSLGEKATYLPNRNSQCHHNHLSYFKFAGRIVAKAIYDNKLLDCYFTRSFYKHILSKPVTYTDMEAEDYSFYQGLKYLLEHDINDLGYELTFSLEVRMIINLAFFILLL